MKYIKKNKEKKMRVFSVYQKLLKKYGPQDWWPILFNKKGKIIRIKANKFNEKETFEICLGAILTQNTSWNNVEKAIINLKKEKLLSPEKIINYPLRRLKKLIRSSGYYNMKAGKIIAFSKWLSQKYNGRLKKFFRKPLKEGRKELLGIHGIGPETADSILLYAGRKPSFVIDAYSKRLCQKYRVKFKTYDEYKDFFERQLPKSYKLYNNFHALIVSWGKEN